MLEIIEDPVKFQNLMLEKINNKKNAYYLNEMYKSVVMAKKIIINLDGNEMLIELGKLLNLNWEYKKKLTNKITNKNIDKIINFGLKNGAYGAKLCGAGGGGFILFLVSKKILKINLNQNYPNLIYAWTLILI